MEIAGCWRGLGERRDIKADNKGADAECRDDIGKHLREGRVFRCGNKHEHKAGRERGIDGGDNIAGQDFTGSLNPSQLAEQKVTVGLTSISSGVEEAGRRTSIGNTEPAPGSGFEGFRKQRCSHFIMYSSGVRGSMPLSQPRWASRSKTRREDCISS